MNILFGILVIIVPLLIIDLLFFLHTAYVKRELYLINKRRRKEAELFEKEFNPLELSDIKSKFTDVVIVLSILFGICYVMFSQGTLWSQKQYLEILKSELMHSSLVFFIYLSIEIIILKVVRFIKQIKGEF